MKESQNEPTIAEPAAGALPPGSMVGRYEILSVLGQGGFGITYRAQDAELRREVAIKEYLPTSLALRQGIEDVVPRSFKTADEFNSGRDRFIDEGRTLALLEHASALVRVFDFLYANGTAYIVMAFVRGETLESKLSIQRRLPVEDVVRLIWPLLDGLEQVHATGFLHRDIKPANILVDAGGNPTLIDFGAARIAVAGNTAAMTSIFTLGYAAAEQFTTGKQGPWTDIYGLSATLYHALAGNPPPSAFDRILDDTHTPLDASRIPNLPPGLAAAVNAGLRVRAIDRPQSVADWRSLLAQTADAAVTVKLARQPGQTSISLPAIGMSLTSSKRRLGFLSGFLALVTAMAVGGYVFLSQRGPAVPAVSSQEGAVTTPKPQTQADVLQPQSGPPAEVAGKWSGSVENWLNDRPGRELTVSARPDGTLACLFFVSGDRPGAAQSCTYKDSLLTIITGANNIVALSPSSGGLLKGMLTVQAIDRSFPITMSRAAP